MKHGRIHGGGGYPENRENKKNIFI